MSNNSSNNAAVLAAQNVTKVVTSPEGNLTILSDISFSVEKGDSIAIVGPSGAGKSTLLALLAGLDLPTSGKIWLDGHCLTDLDEDGRAAARARSVGFVFQSFHLVPSLNALENDKSLTITEFACRPGLSGMWPTVYNRLDLTDTQCQ